MNALRVMEVIYVLILLTVLVSMLIQWRLLDILKRLSALSRLDTKLDLLLSRLASNMTLTQTCRLTSLMP